MWRGALHETTDQAAMFGPVVKEAIRVGSADELGPALARAAAHGAGAPPQRPVYVEVPTDLLDAASAAADVPAWRPPPLRRPRLHGVPIAAAAAALLEARRAPAHLGRRRRAAGRRRARRWRAWPSAWPPR